VFDLSDVLYDATVWRRWLVPLLARFGVRVDYAAFFAAWDRDYLDAVYCGRRRYDEAFQTMLRTTGLTSAQIDEIEAAGHARRRDLATNRRLFPGVRTTLARAQAAGYPLALLCDTDVPATEVRGQLDRLRIGEYFEHIVSSLDLGQTKPHPVGYHAVLTALGRPADRVAFIGHEACDLAMARDVGMATVAFNSLPDAIADVQLQRFSELVDLLRVEADPTQSVADSRSGLN
jgi:phosphoglycolate phosphatase-like HAD superfamily hydrolase